jgi:hypothetical protein
VVGIDTHKNLTLLHIIDQFALCGISPDTKLTFDELRKPDALRLCYTVTAITGQLVSMLHSRALQPMTSKDGFSRFQTPRKTRKGLPFGSMRTRRTTKV